MDPLQFHMDDLDRAEYVIIDQGLPDDDASSNSGDFLGSDSVFVLGERRKRHPLYPTGGPSVLISTFHFHNCRAQLVPRLFFGHVIYEEKIGIPSHYISHVVSMLQRELGLKVAPQIDDQDGWVYSRSTAAAPFNLSTSNDRQSMMITTRIMLGGEVELLDQDITPGSFVAVVGEWQMSFRITSIST